MITIVNRFTGEQICKYRANKAWADKNSFIADVKGSNTFRSRFHAIVSSFIRGGSGTLCWLKDQYAVLECLSEDDKQFWED